ncbi:MAG: type I methionyl aminopeptidase [Candidatus Krumholzibacteria bacterium]|nr:type I methionyl aminopeptidase [Candidatus Krumholzibacteria bacterium]MDH4338142.1 type I methionyl aminopeptidase [Candidatus Krumholzibacteria bacterium]MDH5270964.1 type I methionyl aminopeptidase [Candidatus Krumholzibacteria bacterium]
MIVLKKPDQIEIMQANGTIVVECFAFARDFIRPGRTRRELDAEIERLILERGGKPAFKGFHGYPASTCISVNEEVVHGIPDDRAFVEGDVVGLDIGVFRDGYYVDSARTIPVGRISQEAQRLLDVTWDCLEAGIDQARPGNRLTDISHAVESRARKAGFAVVRSLVGHGIGERMHEDPQVPNFGPPRQGPVLEEGLVIAIEPMINLGTAEVFTLEDGWTIVTADKKTSAHFEDTVAVTKDGPRILTR